MDSLDPLWNEFVVKLNVLPDFHMYLLLKGGYGKSWLSFNSHTIQKMWVLPFPYVPIDSLWVEEENYLYSIYLLWHQVISPKNIASALIVGLSVWKLAQAWKVDEWLKFPLEWLIFTFCFSTLAAFWIYMYTYKNPCWQPFYSSPKNCDDSLSVVLDSYIIEFLNCWAAITGMEIMLVLISLHWLHATTFPLLL